MLEAATAKLNALLSPMGSELMLTKVQRIVTLALFTPAPAAATQLESPRTAPGAARQAPTHAQCEKWVCVWRLLAHTDDLKLLEPALATRL